MIVCKIEIWPNGDSTRAQLVGIVTAANVGGDDAHGDYICRVVDPEDDQIMVGRE